MNIINGKQISEKLINKLTNEVSKLNKEPYLAIFLIGDNYASKKYVSKKMDMAKRIGIKTILIEKDDISEDELIDTIHSFNINKDINGIFVQLPLPSHIDTTKILNLISPNKDVDGFHPVNQGKVLVGDKTGIKSCTPAGIEYMLDEENIDLVGKKVVIIGASNIVGKPMASILINRKATVTICNSKTKNLKEELLTADIIISATGMIDLVSLSDTKDKAIIIDVGINNKDGKLVGDINQESFKDSNRTITPVPGGVGPMTVAMLMYNTVSLSKD